VARVGDEPETSPKILSLTARAVKPRPRIVDERLFRIRPVAPQIVDQLSSIRTKTPGRAAVYTLPTVNSGRI
jgi:hypothetical protein